jgi:diguanylate cyclase (GGDEF)-like protein
VQIEPDKIDFCYMLSLDIGTSLRYMDLWAQQKQYRAELQAMASTDALTGLLNRAGVIRVRERMTGKTSRLAGVIMADLDHLKQINDTFGHNAGDIALTTAAEILKKALGGKQDAEEGKSRPDEKDWVLGRVGGDEYMACFVNVTKEELEERIRRMHGLCDEYNQDSGQPFFVEISAGVAMGRVRNMEDWSLLTTKVDEQLYEAKKGRREFVIREGKV